MKKIFGLLFITVLVLAGCSSTNAEAAVTELNVWAWDPNYNVIALQEAEKVYNEKNPDAQVKLNITEASVTDIQQKLLINLQSGNTSVLPDIVLSEDKATQMFLTGYPDAFVPLTDKVELKDFADYKVASCTAGGETYCLPFDNGVAATFYRRDIYEAAGIKTEDIQDITWDQYLDFGKQIEESQGVKLFPSQLIDETGLIEIMLQSNSSWYVDESGNYTIADNETMKSSVNTLLSSKDKGVNLPTTDWAEWVGAMNTGKVASVTTGAWIIGSILQGEDQSGNWGVAPVPSIDGGTHYSSLGGSSWMVLSSSKQQEKSIDFLNQTFGSDVDFYATLLDQIGAIATYEPVLKTDAYQQEVEFFGGQKVYEDLVKYSMEIPAINYGDDYSTWNSTMKVYLPEVINGTMTVEEMLQKVQADMEKQ